MLLSDQISNFCFRLLFLVSVSSIGHGVHSDYGIVLILRSLLSFSCCAVTVIYYLSCFSFFLTQTQTHYPIPLKWQKSFLQLHCDPRDVFSLALLCIDLLSVKRKKLVCEVTSTLCLSFWPFSYHIDLHCKNNLHASDVCNTQIIHFSFVNHYFPFLTSFVFCDCKQK